MESRELIDSTAVTCLSMIRRVNPVLTSETKASFLSLGIVCVSTPWPDGAGSSDCVTSLLRQAALSLKFDRDLTVSRCAYTALAVCNNIVTQRSPPLVIVKRNENLAYNNKSSNSFYSGAELLSSLKSTTSDIYKMEAAKKRIAADAVSQEEERSHQRVKLQKGNDKDTSDNQEQDKGSKDNSFERTALESTTPKKPAGDSHDLHKLCETNSDTQQIDVIQGVDDMDANAKTEEENEKESILSPVVEETLETSEQEEESDDDGFDISAMIVDAGPDEEDT